MLKAQFFHSPEEAIMLERLLLHIANGEQHEAEMILQRNPSLLLLKGKVTDNTGRVFENISGLQYALWAKDRHMWQMILKYLPAAEAKKQRDELKSKGTKHGKCFDFQPIKSAYQAYLAHHQKYKGEYTDKVSRELSMLWFQIGMVQRSLPAHVMHELLNPHRAMSVDGKAPLFNDEKLDRRIRVPFGVSIYPFKEDDEEKRRGLGYEYVIVRGGTDEPKALYLNHSRLYAAPDLAAILQLEKTRDCEECALEFDITNSARI